MILCHIVFKCERDFLLGAHLPHSGQWDRTAGEMIGKTVKHLYSEDHFKDWYDLKFRTCFLYMKPHFFGWHFWESFCGLSSQNVTLVTLFVHLKVKFGHHLFTLISFQTCENLKHAIAFCKDQTEFKSFTTAFKSNIKKICHKWPWDTRESVFYNGFWSSMFENALVAIPTTFIPFHSNYKGQIIE